MSLKHFSSGDPANMHSDWPAQQVLVISNQYASRVSPTRFHEPLARLCPQRMDDARMDVWLQTSFGKVAKFFSESASWSSRPSRVTFSLYFETIKFLISTRLFLQLLDLKFVYLNNED